jgi:hypothetical protein
MGHITTKGSKVYKIYYMTDSSKYINNSSEYNNALTFLKTGCDCGCSSTVDQERFAKLRSEFQNLTKIEQDTFVMSNLTVFNAGSTAQSPRLKFKMRTNTKVLFLFEYKKPICQKTYLNMLGISQKYLRNVKKHLTTKGLTTRVHGNNDRMPQWKTKMNADQEVKETIKIFILNYAETRGLPDPGRTKRITDLIIFLPTNMSYKSVHRDFLDSRQEGDKLKSLKYGIFLKLWHQLTPNIQFRSPRSDVCDTCHQLLNESHNCSNKNESEKEELKKNLKITEIKKKRKENIIIGISK